MNAVLTENKNVSAIEKMFIKRGEIAAVRSWEGGGIHELDVYLPKVNFEKWDKVQSIKCRTSSYHYTDYSPAKWSAGENICTLYIDTCHSGQGSQWAKQQHKGTIFYYLNIEHERHFPVADKHLVFLGDATSIGHFCAVQQLAVANTNVDGFIVFDNERTASAFHENCPWLLLQTCLSHVEIFDQTESWIQQKPDKEDFIFYIVGNNQMVSGLRKLLKRYGVNPNKIRSKGFWQ